MNEKHEVAKKKPNSLSLTGYRLPTESEYEYAARAQSRTCRCFGETEELLSKYAWYELNAAHKSQTVGRLKPNDFGLFDIHGNVQIWTHNIYEEKFEERQDGKAIDDEDGEVVIDIRELRSLRGGVFGQPASDSRSAERFMWKPSETWENLGFRIARTIAP